MMSILHSSITACCLKIIDIERTLSYSQIWSGGLIITEVVPNGEKTRVCPYQAIHMLGQSNTSVRFLVSTRFNISQSPNCTKCFIDSTHRWPPEPTVWISLSHSYIANSISVEGVGIKRNDTFVGIVIYTTRAQSY